MSYGSGYGYGQVPAPPPEATRRMRAPGYRQPHPGRWVVAIILVIGLLIGLDFGARSIAQGVAASDIQKQAGVSTKPTVTFGGFPFLTQVALKNFRHMTIKFSNLPAGPLTITSINAALNGVKLTSYSFNSGTISSLSGTALISFGSLGSFLTSQLGSNGKAVGLKVTAAGSNEVRASIDTGVSFLSGSALLQLTQSSGNLNIHVVSTSGALSIIGGVLPQNMSVHLPDLPLGLTIQSITVNASGIVGNVTGHNVSISNSS